MAKQTLLSKAESKLLALAKKRDINQVQLRGKPTTNFRDFFRRLFSQKVTVIALVVFLILVITAIAIYYSSPFTETSTIQSFAVRNGVRSQVGVDVPKTIVTNLPPSSQNGGIVEKFLNNSELIQLRKTIGDSNIFKTIVYAPNKILVEFNPYDYLANGIVDNSGNGTYIPGGTKNFIIGTNGAGQDNWTRVWFGLLESLKLGLLVATITTFIGVVFGAYLGFHAGSKVDNYVMRVVDTISGVPFLIWFILFSYILEPGFWPTAIALSSVGWIGPLYNARIYMIRVKNLDFIDAARTTGISKLKLIYKYALPYSLGRLLSLYVRLIPIVIIWQASLAFLGFSSSTDANLGAIINDAKSNLNNVAYLITPVTIIFATTLSLQLVANGVNVALDPKEVQ